MQDLPILGITMGDPAGIGPEIAAKASTHEHIYATCRPMVVGDVATMIRATRIVGATALTVRKITHVSEARFEPQVMNVFDPGEGLDHDIEPGQLSTKAGDLAFEAVRRVIDLAMKGEVDATVTGPINKEAMHLAGHKFPGHTEIFAHFTNTPNYTMMLVEGRLRVVHVSTHVSLRLACDLVTQTRVYQVIELANSAARQLGIDCPRIGVAGLNPHASDGGLFGSEERESIIPAVAQARAAGFNVDGPVPPDTFFPRAVGGAYDVAVAMYHDQGHIPVKMMGFHYDDAKKAWTAVNGINITLGLPIIRVSVDHGTAFDQAGRGTASEASLLNAIEHAAQMAHHRTLA